MDTAQTSLELLNTLTGEKKPFEPMHGNKVSMYVCGPTVYDDAHLGHARCYITWDVLYRFLKFLGYDVTYVRNVTDVDDKILNRAKERGELPSVLAERNYHSFAEDMRALNVLPPDEEPRATQHIQDMLDGICALIQKNAAYATPDGSVYFRVASKADYGKLKFHTDNPTHLKKHLDELKSGARVEVGEEKESPLDFALWKAVPLDEPNGWESPWPAKGASKGWGRPGWHMECSAMNHAIFGDQIDIHAGGADLIFPHHENEIAQSEAWTGKTPFAKYWLHNGFVNVSGEKMSKSLGNFSTIKKVLERYDANTIRYFLLTNGYRMPVDFNDEALQAAKNWTERVYRTIRNICKKLDLSAENLQTLVIDDYKNLQTEKSEWPIIFKFIEYMGNDLNTARALPLITEGFKTITSILDSASSLSQKDIDLAKKQLSDVITVFSHLGFSWGLAFPQENQQIDTPASSMMGVGLGASFKGEVIPGKESLRASIQERKQAKAEKDWTKADAIRNELINQGLQLLDNKDGTTSVEKDGVEILRV